MHPAALFLLASLSTPTAVASLPTTPSFNCDVLINLIAMTAEVSCRAPVTLGQALDYVNEVSLKNNAGTFMTYPTATAGIVTSRKWRLPLIQY